MLGPPIRFRKIALLLFAVLATALASAPARAESSVASPASSFVQLAQIDVVEVVPPSLRDVSIDAPPCTPALRASHSTSARYLVHCALLL
jgi:hypothetical protein